jgi:CBS domain-containing protein
MKAIKIAKSPPPTVTIEDTVTDVVGKLEFDHGCAAAVVDAKQKFVGTVSKDDVLARCVAAGLDPKSTHVADVMTRDPIQASPEMDAQEALKLMLSKGQCYMPVVDQDGRVTAWLAICRLFQDHVEDLSGHLDTLAAYIAADGPGG